VSDSPTAPAAVASERSESSHVSRNATRAAGNCVAKQLRTKEKPLVAQRLKNNPGSDLLSHGARGRGERAERVEPRFKKCHPRSGELRGCNSRTKERPLT
jgi:hypothetical protein